jgi:hypothetical protein
VVGFSPPLPFILYAEEAEMHLKHMALMHNVAMTHLMIGNSNGNQLWRTARDAHLEELEMYERGNGFVVSRNSPYVSIRLVSEKILDDLVIPIFPNPIKRDTFTFKVQIPKKGAMKIVAQQLCPGGHFDVYSPVLPVVNVGTIGHVDFARRPFEVCLQRSGVLHQGPSA